jgi:hypothetical protein
MSPGPPAFDPTRSRPVGGLPVWGAKRTQQLWRRMVTIAEGLLLSDDEQFDVESATADELREYLRRAKARRGTRGAAI